MNAPLLLAGTLAVAVAAVHSVQGERLLFARLRWGSWIPTEGGALLREAHVRILWASWHVLSVFGLLAAAGLFWAALVPLPAGTRAVVAGGVAGAMGLGSLLVLVGTRGRHAGWVGMGVVAGLSGWGAGL
ncbi:MAG: hypothetical protein JNM33_01710 [Rubrivivax sp.]|nr:hypothetical protein [Rubrivivax sp.]